MPFFTYGNNQINTDSIEGNAIETFIDKHNLTTEWKYENFKWGNQDENGTFNGIVGRVILKFRPIRTYTFPTNVFRLDTERQMLGSHVSATF